MSRRCRMDARLAVALAFLALAAGHAWADGGRLIVTPEGAEEPMKPPELPFPEGEGERFAVVGERSLYTPENLSDYINGGAAFYLGYSFEWLAVWRLKVDGVESEIVAELYAFSRPEDALGVFIDNAALDSPSERFERERVSKGLCRAQSGRAFARVAVRDRSDAGSDLAREVAGLLAQTLDERPASVPSVVRCLPGDGLREGSVRYFHSREALSSYYFVAEDNILGLSPETDCALASYEQTEGASPLRLLVVRYPDAEERDRAQRRFRETYLELPASDDPPESESATLEGGALCLIARSESASALIIAFDAADAARAESLTHAAVDALEEGDEP